MKFLFEILHQLLTILYLFIVSRMIGFKMSNMKQRVERGCRQTSPDTIKSHVTGHSTSLWDRWKIPAWFNGKRCFLQWDKALLLHCTATCTVVTCPAALHRREEKERTWAKEKERKGFKEKRKTAKESSKVSKKETQKKGRVSLSSL